MVDRDDIDHGGKIETCYICGQPAGGGEMRDGAHLLCSWGLSDQERAKFVTAYLGHRGSPAEL